MGFSGYHVCYHCKDRTYDCHSKCELYKKEKQEMEEKRKQRNIESDINDFIYNTRMNRIKSLKQHKINVH